METPPPGPGVDPVQLDPLCSLDDPTRRRLYEYVAAQPEPVTRDQVSAALDVERSTVVYHLDKLVDQGLLATSFARPEGRGGPGAGRPAKHYERADREFAVSVPPRDYRLAADLLARAAAADTTGTVRTALERAAAELGRELAVDGEASPDLTRSLARHGFEPYLDGEVMRLRNCPFDRLAQEHTELVCSMNLALLAAATDATGAPFRAHLDPAADRCCVAFEPTTPQAS